MRQRILPTLSKAPQVIAIGASAGGLEAMLVLFARIPKTENLCFVVAQHMAKGGHDELLTRLIGRESTLNTKTAEHDEVLLADTIYVIPAGQDGRITGGHEEKLNTMRIKLSPPAPEHYSTPSVNCLFGSLAQCAGKHAVAVLLSGAGSDGTSGCQKIRAAGGWVLVQDPLEAKFNGMINAAIAHSVVDHTVSLEQLAGLLIDRLAPHYGKTPAPLQPTQVPDEERQELNYLLKLVLEKTGIDFSAYKEETLLRRLNKRKSQLNVEGRQAYLAFIRQHPDELGILQHQFLVSVSSFFRDRPSFEKLAEALLERIQRLPSGVPFRIWVPGCASGEEPYTLAILLLEIQRQTGQYFPIEIVGTDLNPEALALANKAIYRETAFKEIDTDILSRYFTEHGHHFGVNQALKRCVRFEQRDVLNGTPLDQLDLVSCRNLLIYLKGELQDQLMLLFHQALAPQGLLFIGQSESLSITGNSLFGPIDRFHRLYQRRH